MSRTIVAQYFGAESRQMARENMRYKVLIADDHGVVRKGLRLLLEQYPELVVVGEAANGREAVTMAATLSPQVVVLDVAMPILNGIEAVSTVEDRRRDLIIRTQRSEGGEVRVAVQDSGIGFDPLNAERIFDAFHTTKPGGLGMGLSISRSIVENHGGRLWAVLNDGPGATFQFTL